MRNELLLHVEPLLEAFEQRLCFPDHEQSLRAVAGLLVVDRRIVRYPHRRLVDVDTFGPHDGEAALGAELQVWNAVRDPTLESLQ
jgi:hypothetical protein